MASYGSNATVQTTVYGSTNSDLDTACTSARDFATSIINAKLGLKTDMTPVPDVVTRCCNLLAAGVISTSPEDKVEASTYWKMGMLLLESMGEEVEGGLKYQTITADGFGRYSDYDDYTPDGIRVW